MRSQSPQAGQFNSYDNIDLSTITMEDMSQSPQAGQFNSYGLKFFQDGKLIYSLNPLKRVNSILT